MIFPTLPVAVFDWLEQDTDGDFIAHDHNEVPILTIERKGLGFHVKTSTGSIITYRFGRVMTIVKAVEKSAKEENSDWTCEDDE